MKMEFEKGMKKKEDKREWKGELKSDENEEMQEMKGGMNGACKEEMTGNEEEDDKGMNRGWKWGSEGRWKRDKNEEVRK